MHLYYKAQCFAISQDDNISDFQIDLQYPLS